MHCKYFFWNDESVTISQFLMENYLCYESKIVFKHLISSHYLGWTLNSLQRNNNYYVNENHAYVCMYNVCICVDLEGPAQDL